MKGNCIMDFEIDGTEKDSFGYIVNTVGFRIDGTLWFHSCCGSESIQLNVHEAIALRAAVNEFIASNGVA